MLRSLGLLPTVLDTIVLALRGEIRLRAPKRQKQIFLLQLKPCSVKELWLALTGSSTRLVFPKGKRRREVKLYVAPEARQTGAGRALMQAAGEHARQHGFARLDLSTAKTNHHAQALYESLGWVRDDVFLVYNKTVSPA